MLEVSVLVPIGLIRFSGVFALGPRCIGTRCTGRKISRRQAIHLFHPDDLK